MMKKNNKGAGADLLLEIILSTIVFFVIVVFLFGVQAQKQVIQAKAHVLSADAALACELSMTNLMRSNSSAGITYEEWLMNSYIMSNSAEMANWLSNVSLLYDSKLFSPGDWELNVTYPNGTSIVGTGNIKNIEKKQVFNCTYYVQFPQIYSKYYCFPDILPYEIKGVTGSAEFNTPEGAKIVCEIAITPELKVIKSKDCPLDLQQSLLEEEIENFVLNTEELDSITLPLLVGKSHYELTVEETAEKSEALAKLEKRALIEDCSLHVDFTTTNITA